MHELRNIDLNSIQCLQKALCNLTIFTPEKPFCQAEEIVKFLFFPSEKKKKTVKQRYLKIYYLALILRSYRIH